MLWKKPSAMVVIAESQVCGKQSYMNDVYDIFWNIMEADYSTHEIRIKRLVRIFSVDTERWGDDDHDKFLTPGQQLRPLRSLVLFAQGWGCGQCRETTSNCWFLWRKLLCLTMILFLPLVSLLEMCMRIEDLWIFAWTSKTCCDFDSFEINRFGQPVNLVWTPPDSSDSGIHQKPTKKSRRRKAGDPCWPAGIERLDISLGNERTSRCCQDVGGLW